jgi:hypothetical protein
MPGPTRSTGTLNARAGGCFCERLSSGGSVQHGRVLYADPGKLLRLDAPLGPFQDMGVRAVLTFKLEPDGPGTRVTMTYLVAGDIDGPRMAPMVDQVMGGQMARLIAAARR